MLVKKENKAISVYTMAEDGFNREDSRLIQLVSRLSRKFPNKTTSLFDSESKYDNDMSCVMKISSNDVNAVANIIRLCGIRADIK